MVRLRTRSLDWRKKSGGKTCLHPHTADVSGQSLRSQTNRLGWSLSEPML